MRSAPVLLVLFLLSFCLRPAPAASSAPVPLSSGAAPVVVPNLATQEYVTGWGDNGSPLPGSSPPAPLLPLFLQAVTQERGNPLPVGAEFSSVPGTPGIVSLQPIRGTGDPLPGPGLQGAGPGGSPVTAGCGAPIGTPDAYRAFGDGTLSVAAPGFLGNDIDLEGEALTAVSIVESVDHGSLSAFADGSFNYAPEAGFTGTDSFSYRMRDASDNFADSVTVTIEVLPPANRNPIGVPDRYAMPAGVTLSITAPGFLGNDADLDGEALAAVSIQGTVDHGALSAFANGSFTYTPEPGFTGTDSFLYRMRDASGHFADSVLVTIDVYPGNRPPVGTDDEFAVVAETPLSIAAPGFLINDTDPDGDALTATSIVRTPDHGALAAFSNGSFTYTPETGFTGTDSFAYRMHDSAGNLSDSVRVTLDVHGPGTVPVGTPDAYRAYDDRALAIAAPGFLGNDIDLDGETLTAVSIQRTVDHGSLSAFANGSFNYTPEAGFTGTDSFLYRMRDASDNYVDSVMVTIEVLPPANRAPIGVPDRYAMPGGMTLAIAAPGFLGNDVDLDGEALAAVSIQDAVDHGTLSAFADGSFTYTPEPGFTGTDSFLYRMRDASGHYADSVLVTIDVYTGNRPPLGTDDEFAVVAETPLSIAAPGFLINDTDPDGDALTATAIVDAVDHGSLSAFADGSFTYTPSPGFSGVDSFAYRMRDAAGNLSDSVRVVLDVINPETPIVGAVTAPSDPVLVGAVVNAAAGFASHASGPYTASWDWGDGTTSAGVVVENDCVGTVSGDHVYMATGIFTVTLTVTSEHGLTGESTFAPLTVVGPGGGSVAAGGWIPSPAGAYVPGPSPEGRATFSFNCRYTVRDTVPRGAAQLKLPAARFSFSSSAFDWLIVDGGNVTVQGTGTIDKTGHCRFRISAVDGKIAGGDDRLRIRIWDLDAGDALVYDNQPGDPDTAALSAIGEGQINVQGDGPGRGIVPLTEVVPVQTLLLQNAPNPFRSQTTISFDLSPEDGGSAEIEIFDVSGRLIRSLDASGLTAGHHSLTWSGEDSRGRQAPTGVYFYRLTTAGHVETKRMIKTR